MTSDQVELRAEMFANLVFKPHGDYVAKLEGQIIHSEITGPLNVEMIRLYRDAVRPLWLAAAEKGNFGTLAVFHENMLMTMDAIEPFIQATGAFAAKFPNYIGIAQVADASVVGRLQMAHIYRTRVYGPLGLRYEIFETVNEARDWLQFALSTPRDLPPLN
jgi:hypothetical protein